MFGGAYMRTFGVVNEIDSWGRVELPGILMSLCDIRIGESLEMYLEDESIVLKHSVPTCTFCGSTSDVNVHKERSICRACIEELKNYSL